jgi:peroxiredoxin
MTRGFIRIGVAAACAALYAAAIAAGPGPSKAEMDKPVTDFTLKDLMHDAKEGEKAEAAAVTLSKLKGKKPVVLFFMSATCGTTWKYEKRVGKLMKDHPKDVAFFSVRCSANDTPESIRKFAEQRNFAMPLLNDEKGEVTSYYAFRNTPAFALIDKDGVLRYKGGFDDHANESQVQNTYLADAVTAVLAGKEVTVKVTRPLG